MAYLRERYPRARILVRGHNAELLHRLDTIRARWRLGGGRGWTERLRALGVGKQLRMVRGYLSDELRCARLADVVVSIRSEEHTSELQSLMRSSYAVFCLKKKKLHIKHNHLRLITTQESNTN